MHLKLVFIASLLVSPAMASDFAVTDEDQKNILVICDIAAQSPPALVTRELRTGISGFCLAWQRRIDAAQNPTPPPAKQ